LNVLFSGDDAEPFRGSGVTCRPFAGTPGHVIGQYALGAIIGERIDGPMLWL
jgi:hypothetical protein